MTSKKPRKKKCKVCDMSFMPYRTTQTCCSLPCAMTFAREKTAKKEAGLNILRNERTNLEKLSLLKESTKKLVHAFIRERDHGMPCISCGTPWKSNFQAGHRFNVNQYNGIRFNLLNIHGQCERCNIHLNGNYEHYHSRITDRIGKENYDILESKAKIALRVPHTFTRYELREIQNFVKEARKEWRNGQKKLRFI